MFRALLPAPVMEKARRSREERIMFCNNATVLRATTGDGLPLLISRLESAAGADDDVRRRRGAVGQSPAADTDDGPKRRGARCSRRGRRALTAGGARSVAGVSCSRRGRGARVQLPARKASPVPAAAGRSGRRVKGTWGPELQSSWSSPAAVRVPARITATMVEHSDLESITPLLQRVVHACDPTFCVGSFHSVSKRQAPLRASGGITQPCKDFVETTYEP
jgi:hypothetical protein